MSIGPRLGARWDIRLDDDAGFEDIKVPDLGREGVRRAELAALELTAMLQHPSQLIPKHGIAREAPTEFRGPLAPAEIELDARIEMGLKLLEVLRLDCLKYSRPYAYEQRITRCLIDRQYGGYGLDRNGHGDDRRRGQQG